MNICLCTNNFATLQTLQTLVKPAMAAFTQYNMTKDVANTILSLGPEVCIFGGYVRDSILHDHNAQQFYKTVKDPIDRVQLYNDVKYLPEFADRCLTPCDIDCFMSTSTIATLVKSLSDAKYSVKVRTAKPLSEYHDGVDITNDLKITKMSVRFDMAPMLAAIVPYEIKSMCVDVDIVHAEDISGMQPPFGKIDFMCNALILREKNINISPLVICTRNDPFSVFEKLSSIIDGIKKKVTEPGDGKHSYRTDKMTSKGWTIELQHYTIKKGALFGKNETCLLCLDKIKGNGQCMKRSCCASIYHSTCFTNMTTHDNFKYKCPMCSDPMPEISPVGFDQLRF